MFQTPLRATDTEGGSFTAQLYITEMLESSKPNSYVKFFLQRVFLTATLLKWV